MQTQALICHPDVSPAPPLRIEAGAGLRADAAAIVFQYVLMGDLSRLRIPAPAGGERRDGLWQHTCFEAFVRATPGGPYVEWNFAPSTDWAGYRFTAYRDGMTALPATPMLSVELAEGRLSLRAQVPLFAPGGAVPTPGPGAVLPPRCFQLALTAVVEGVDGARSYWALAHPPGPPDFHHEAGFTMKLEGITP